MATEVRSAYAEESAVSSNIDLLSAWIEAQMAYRNLSFRNWQFFNWMIQVRSRD